MLRLGACPVKQERFSVGSVIRLDQGKVKKTAGRDSPLDALHSLVAEDLRDDPPDYVVVMDYAPDFPELSAMIAAGYEEIATQNDWRLFARSGP